MNEQMRYTPAHPVRLRAVFESEDGGTYEWEWRPQLPEGHVWFMTEWEVLGPNGVPLVSMPLR